MRKIAAAAAAIPLIIYMAIMAVLRRLFPAGSQDARSNSSVSNVAVTDSKWESTKDQAVYRDPAAPPVRGLGDGSVRGPATSSVRGLSGGSIRGQGTIPARGLDTTRAYSAAPAVVYDLEVAQAHRPANGPRRKLIAGAGQLLAMGVAVALLVGGLMLGLPAKQVISQAPVTFAPVAPQQGTGRAQSDLPLDVGFQLKFTKPMNQASVQNALTISPKVDVNLQWDAVGETVALVPSTHWDPHTTYVVAVGGTATDQQGLGLANEIQAQFESGSLTSGDLVATDMVGPLASPGTSFQLTFTRPVKLVTVQTHLMLNALPSCPPVDGVIPASVFGSCPAVDGVVPALVCPVVDGPPTQPVNGACPNDQLDIIGDDPTDVASQVFTATPHTQLVSQATYVVSFAAGKGNTAASDSAGAVLQPVSPLQVTTLAAPAVTRFKPQDGSTTFDANQPISVRFSTAMELRSTAAAFSVTVDGVAIAGIKSWSEGNTVLVLTPRRPFAVGAVVVATVKSSARAVGGLHLATTYSASFKVAKEPPKPIGYTARPTKSSPWYASEVYYLALMNCTRTGGWVTSGGSCSSVTHHTLPAQGRLRLSAGISNAVSRPYAKYMATYKLLDHYLHGSTPHSRMCSAGYCGGGWGENIANGGRGMIAIEIFYQNEYWCRCEHYANIMNGHFSQAGIGVWVIGGTSRVAIDFYS